jgi:hypothetical protein
MRKNRLFLCIAMLALWFSSAVKLSVCEITFLPNETFDVLTPVLQGLTIPENNSIVVIPPTLKTSRYLKQLPCRENLPYFGKTLTQELDRFFDYSVTYDDTFSYPKEWQKKNSNSTRFPIIADHFKGSTVRTVIYTEISISGSGFAYKSGIPIQSDKNTGAIFATGKFQTTTTVFAMEQGIAIAEFESEHEFYSKKLNSFYNNESQVIKYLSELMNTVSNYITADIAFQADMDQLKIVRPAIQYKHDKKKNYMTVFAGSLLGVEEKDTFAAYRKQGEYWIPVARITAREVGAESCYCKASLVSGQEFTPDTIVFAYDEDTAGRLRVPKMGDENKSSSSNSSNEPRRRFGKRR